MPTGFSGDPLTAWCSGGSGYRKMELCERFSFTDHEREWVADKGRLIDGASIPRALWTAVGAPYVGRYRRPSIIHDIACEDAESEADRRAADRMFYRACRSEGLARVESAILYCGVRFGAWMSGGHFRGESSLPRLTEDLSDQQQQRTFEELAQSVVVNADRLSVYPENEEAIVLEQAFDASLQRMIGKLIATSPETRVLFAAARFDDNDHAFVSDRSAATALLEPGHMAPPLAGDIEFGERLIDSPCGEENRVAVENTRTFPHSTICYLVLNGRFGSARGTGFFIAPDTILTAGHCLHGRLGYIRSAQVIAGRDGDTWPFESVVARTFRVPPEWSSGGRVEFDYGIIRLGDTALGDQVGYFDTAILTDEELGRAELTTAGYPSDVSSSTRQHVNSGSCEFVAPQRIGYGLDTWKGASGSPVWTTRDGKISVVGIHNYGHCPNLATRINARVKSDLQRWVTDPVAG